MSQRILKVLPINTRIERDKIDKLGQAVVREFPNRYGGYQVIPPARLSFEEHPELFRDVEEDWSRAVAELRPDMAESDIPLTRALRINSWGIVPLDSPDMQNYIYRSFGGDVLALTDYLMMTIEGYYLVGSKLRGDTTNPDEYVSAIVSTAFIRTAKQWRILPRLLPQAVHEVGHLEKLGHHLFEKQNHNYCPMGELHEIAALSNWHTSDPRLYDHFDPSLCVKCKSLLG
jgi:hypothetical protein